MNPEDFCYWLKGYIIDKDSLNRKDTSAVKKKLNSVFEHVIDKQYEGKDKKTQAIHDGTDTGNGRPRC